MADTTLLDSLKGVSAYPVPLRTLTEVAVRRGLTLTDEATAETLAGKAYNLAVADVLLWLSLAPDITQGGQSFSFTDEQRTLLRNRANTLYGDYATAEDTGTAKTIYGYKGSRL